MKISLIIPVYKAEDYLRDSLKSALTQKDKKFFEIIVVDDGSDYPPDNIVNELSKNIVLIKQKTNKGVSAARNKGVDVAAGDYVAFLDADDILVPDYLIKMTKFIEDNSLDCAGCWLYYMTSIWNNGRVIKTYPLINEELCNPTNFPSGFIIKKTLYSRFNGFNEHLRTSEDYEFFSRIYASGVSVFNYAEPLVGYRINLFSVTSTGKEKKMFFSDLIGLVYQNNINIPIERFDEIYSMRLSNNIPSDKWAKNEYFEYVFKKYYPWRELVELRKIYVLWLDHRYVKCFAYSMNFIFSYPAYITEFIKRIFK